MTPTEKIQYDHDRNVHTVDGPRAAIPLLTALGPLTSVLDVGCGRGTWLRAAIENGAKQVVGVDGVAISDRDLLIPSQHFHVRDLQSPLDLGERFGLVLCLEVAEHLPETGARQLIKSLTRHSDRILFAGACPGQPGQHHVNCQWPSYWQGLFNEQGYACSDWPRWRIWGESRIEVWYRQNVMVAERSPERAGKEDRIASVIHPEMLVHMAAPYRVQGGESTLARIEDGRFPPGKYVSLIVSAFWRKLLRRFSDLAGDPK